ncbi:MAG: hypothetical protein AB9882_02530 [Ignavibacteriaceae bacterium]
MKEKPKCPRCGTGEYVEKIDEGALVCLRPIRMREDGSFEKCWCHIIADDKNKPGAIKGKTYSKRQDTIMQSQSLIDAIGKESLQRLLNMGILGADTVRAYNIKLEYSKLINSHKLTTEKSITILAGSYRLSGSSIKRIVYSKYPKLIKTEKE